jgi:hypothetical protein
MGKSNHPITKNSKKTKIIYFKQKSISKKKIKKANNQIKTNNLPLKIIDNNLNSANILNIYNQT